MSPLPGNRVPAESVRSVFDRNGTEWTWDADTCLFTSTDPSYTGPAVTEPGAIPAELQPTFAAPPNDAQRVAMELRPEDR